MRVEDKSVILLRVHPQIKEAIVNVAKENREPVNRYLENLLKEIFITKTNN